MQYLTVHGAIRILLGSLLGIALSINSGCTLFIAKTAYKEGKALVSRMQSGNNGSQNASNERSDGNSRQSQ